MDSVYDNTKGNFHYFVCILLFIADENFACENDFDIFVLIILISRLGAIWINIEVKRGNLGILMFLSLSYLEKNSINDNVDSVQGNVVRMKVKRNGVTSTQLGKLFEGVDFDDWPIGDQQVAQADLVVDDSHI
ncbi:hypothetical protein DM860_001197 [Cuscuta australis]|uniref:Uncharacterized protein n=1 Tax=Cuscuta australis TaxID=267555 RepID=A0A328DT19_9ASTE|nr:hypothetical protein DM860_001197 [Cuscuta australis]